MPPRYRSLGGPKRLGDRLLEAGLITRTQLDVALEQQADDRDDQRSLGRVLVDLGFLTDHDLVRMLGVHLQIPVALSAVAAPEKDAIHAISPALARRHRAVPYRLVNGSLLVAVADRLAAQAVDEIRIAADRPVVVHLAPEAEIAAALAKHYPDGVTEVLTEDSATASDDAADIDDSFAPDVEPVPDAGPPTLARFEDLSTRLNDLVRAQYRQTLVLAEVEEDLRSIADGDLRISAELRQAKEDSEALRRALLAVIRELQPPEDLPTA